MYTIFKNDSSIILCGSGDCPGEAETLDWSAENCSRVIASVAKNEGHSFVLIGDDPDAMFFDFKKAFKTVEAAGGVVRNHSGQTLFIYRHETWDLPKGKLDRGETPDEAALREVEEECGFSSLELQDFLANTYHIYEEKGRSILKITHWYSMHSNENQLKPQLEEGITALRWLAPEQMDLVFENTYPNIRLLISGLHD